MLFFLATPVKDLCPWGLNIISHTFQFKLILCIAINLNMAIKKFLYAHIYSLPTNTTEGCLARAKSKEDQGRIDFFFFFLFVNFLGAPSLYNNH